MSARHVHVVSDAGEERPLATEAAWAEVIRQGQRHALQLLDLLLVAYDTYDAPTAAAEALREHRDHTVGILDVIHRSAHEQRRRGE